MDKALKIFLNSVPILVMVGMIPLIGNDYLLGGGFIVVIFISFLIERGARDWIIFITGFFLMIFFEAIFISTGVEVFYRNSLFGIMPIWLPILWAYGFVVIGRAVKILDK
jgi:hypothetical protein